MTKYEIVGIGVIVSGEFWTLLPLYHIETLFYAEHRITYRVFCRELCRTGLALTYGWRIM